MSPVQSGDENIISFVLLGHHATTYLIRVCPDAMIYALMRTKQCRTLFLFINIYFRGFSCPVLRDAGRQQKSVLVKFPDPVIMVGGCCWWYLLFGVVVMVSIIIERKEIPAFNCCVQEEGQIPLLLFTSGIIEFKSKWEILVPCMT